MTRRWLALAALLALAPACRGETDDDLLVLAAASLSNALTALDGVAEDAGLDPQYSFAGSQVVMEQVRQGAPADVVAVADVELLSSGAVVFARTELVVVATASGPVRTVDALAAPNVRVVLAGEAVPAGRYAREGLARLGILDAVEANVVSEEPDVRAVAARVALGEADAGVVYATDARADGRLRVVGDPLPVEAAYSAEVAPDAPHPAAARRFVELLTSPAARRVFQRLGFSVP